MRLGQSFISVWFNSFIQLIHIFGILTLTGSCRQISIHYSSNSSITTTVSLPPVTMTDMANGSQPSSTRARCHLAVFPTAVIPNGMELLLELKATYHLWPRLWDHWVHLEASINVQGLGFPPQNVTMLQFFPPFFMEVHFSPIAWNNRVVLGIRKMKGKQTKGQISTFIYSYLESIWKDLKLRLWVTGLNWFFLYFWFLKFCIQQVLLS